MKALTTLLAAMATITLPTIATAAPVEQASQTVRLGDLDLGSRAGRNRAETRIANAAKSVCGGGYERDLTALAAFHTCFDQARGDALVALRSMTATVEVAAR